MRLFSYIVTYDSGFAPNPFWGCCTIATCKPAIRRTGQVGDWIVGLTPKAQGNRIVYAMRVGEILPMARYFTDERFLSKRPDYSRGEVVYKCGDNCYQPLPSGGFRQLQSTHTGHRPMENPDTKKHDLDGLSVLVSDVFHYFGRRAVPLPPSLQELKVGRAHKNKFSAQMIADFLEFIGRQQPGVHAPPEKWPDHDISWRQ